MIDQLIELPLPGRVLAAPRATGAAGTADVALPSFVAGPENRLVTATIARLLDRATFPISDNTHATSDALSPPAVVALFGPTGTGKTHLARGLARHWQQQRGTDAAEYVTAADFRRALIDALNTDAIAAFRRHFRDRPLLVIDDLQRLPNDGFLLEELRYTLDELEAAGRTLVVTSERPVGTLANLSPELRSRLSSGLVLQLSPAAAPARERMVAQISRALGHPLSEQAASRLAAAFTGSANELCGAVFEICGGPHAQSAGDHERTDRFLAARDARQPTLREIIAVVARFYRIPQKLLKSGSRKQSAVLARATVVFLARELTDASHAHIGQLLGGRDHSTIMHNYHKLDDDRKHDPALQESLDELRRILSSN